MRILVRLPNWLGDLVMSVAFVEELRNQYPDAAISMISKKGIDGLVDYFPQTEHRFIFSKSDYKGMRGLWRFGRELRAAARFDLFFSLPDSFSAAFIGFAAGARVRVGFKKEGRGFLLSQSYPKPQGLHRVAEYLALIEAYSGRPAVSPQVRLRHSADKGGHIVVNINSEAQSRRLTERKAVEILTELRRTVDAPIVLIGAPKEADFVTQVYNALPEKTGVENRAGATGLTELANLLASARAMLTTDSGPAHLANALGTQTVVLFGAGNERNTAPYNSAWNEVIRLGQLPCEPCLKNRCVCFELPQCLERLSAAHIVERVQAYL